MKYLKIIVCLCMVIFGYGCGSKKEPQVNELSYTRDVNAKKIILDELPSYLPMGVDIFVEVKGNLIAFPSEANKIPKKIYFLFDRKISFSAKKGDKTGEIVKDLQKCLKVPVRFEDKKIIIQAQR